MNDPKESFTSTNTKYIEICDKDGGKATPGSKQKLIKRFKSFCKEGGIVPHRVVLDTLTDYHAYFEEKDYETIFEWLVDELVAFTNTKPSVEWLEGEQSARPLIRR